MATGKPKNQEVPVNQQQERGSGGSLERRPQSYGSLGRSGGGGRYAMSPFSFVRRMMEDMDRMFEGFGGGMLPSDLFEESPLELGQMSWPQIEMMERDGNLIVRADLPGLDKKDIRVNLEDDSIVIEGERRAEHEDKREGYFHSERSYGSFQRRIPLPRGVDVSSCDAHFENGVLEVKLKLPKSTGRSVEIRGGGGGAQALSGQPGQAGQTGPAGGQTNVNQPVNQPMNQPGTRSNQNGPSASR